MNDLSFNSEFSEIKDFWLDNFYRIKSRRRLKKFEIDLAKFLYYGMRDPFYNIDEFLLKIKNDDTGHLKFIQNMRYEYYYKPPNEIHYHICRDDISIPLILHEIGHFLQYKQNRIVSGQNMYSKCLMWQEIDAWHWAWSFMKTRGFLSDNYKKIILLSILSYLKNFLILKEYSEKDLLNDLSSNLVFIENNLYNSLYDEDFIDFVKEISKGLDIEVPIWDYNKFLKIAKTANEAKNILKLSRIV